MRKSLLTKLEIGLFAGLFTLFMTAALVCGPYQRDDGSPAKDGEHCGCRADKSKCEIGRPDKCGACCSVLPCPQERCAHARSTEAERPGAEH